MEKNIVLISDQFHTDISDLDFEILLQPKLWPSLEEQPSYSALDAEIIHWLESNVPEIYRLAVQTSKRKAHDKNLINAIKAKVLFEQLDYVGLRSLQNGRFFNLFGAVFENTFKALNQVYKKHDVKSEFVHARPHTYNRNNIEPDTLYCRYGTSMDSELSRIEVLLDMQPDSTYLNLCKTLCLETQLLDDMRRSIETINFSPKDQSQHQTCACCFRWIRLQPNDRTRIAYHGYKKDDWGTDIVNSSCDGAKYPPLQISAEGTIAKLEKVRKRQLCAQTELEKLGIDLNDFAQVRALEKEQREHAFDLKHTVGSCKFFFDLALGQIKKLQPSRLDEAKAIIA